MTVGCNALRLILRNFSSLIKTNVQAPVGTVGVDISREERCVGNTILFWLILSSNHVVILLISLSGTTSVLNAMKAYNLFGLFS